MFVSRCLVEGWETRSKGLAGKYLPSNISAQIFALEYVWKNTWPQIYLPKYFTFFTQIFCLKYISKKSLKYICTNMFPPIYLLYPQIYLPKISLKYMCPNIYPSNHTWYLSFFVHQRIWKFYAKKMRKFMTKIASRQNSVNNLVFWSAYLVFFLAYFHILMAYLVFWLATWRSLLKKVRQLKKSTPMPWPRGWRSWLISSMQGLFQGKCTDHPEFCSKHLVHHP